jgi:hypothetical protein
MIRVAYPMNNFDILGGLFLKFWGCLVSWCGDFWVSRSQEEQQKCGARWLCLLASARGEFRGRDPGAAKGAQEERNAVWTEKKVGETGTVSWRLTRRGRGVALLCTVG